MTRKGSQVQVLYGPPLLYLVRGHFCFQLLPFSRFARPLSATVSATRKSVCNGGIKRQWRGFDLSTVLRRSVAGRADPGLRTDRPAHAKDCQREYPQRGREEVEAVATSPRRRHSASRRDIDRGTAL